MVSILAIIVDPENNEYVTVFFIIPQAAKRKNSSIIRVKIWQLFFITCFIKGISITSWLKIRSAPHHQSYQIQAPCDFYEIIEIVPIAMSGKSNNRKTYSDDAKLCVQQSAAHCDCLIWNIEMLFLFSLYYYMLRQLILLSALVTYTVECMITLPLVIMALQISNCLAMHCFSLYWTV